MALPQDIAFETFSKEVIWVIMSELGRFREGWRLRCQETPPYYRDIGKAAVVFALLHQQHVVSTMAKLESKLMSSRYLFDTFVANFAEKFFQSIETVPREYYLLIILTFSGVLGVMADFCFQREQMQLVQECCFNLEMELEMGANDFKEVGSWEGLRKIASPLAALYDSLDWDDSGFEKLSARLSDIFS